MSSKLVLCLMAGLVIWLFRKGPPQAKEKRVSGALWIPLAWIVILGSRPLSAWFGVEEVFDSADDYLEGSPFDRAFFLALIVAATVVLMRRGVRWGELFAHNKWLVIYFLYIGLTCLWSDYPVTSFKRWVKDVGNVVMVLLVHTEKDPLHALKTLLSRCCYLLIPGSVLLVKYMPQLGRYYDRWTYQPHYCGVATDKNLFGMVLFVSSTFLVWALVEARSVERGPRSKREFWIYGALLVFTTWLLLKAQSSTALGASVLGAGIILSMRYDFFRSRAKNLGAYAAGFVFLALLLQSTVDISSILVKVLGRDLTLTGRTDIWGLVLKEKTNPVVGVGFYSFWLGDRSARLSEKYFYRLNEAHNGYLETYLDTGLVGVALLVLLTATALRRVGGEVAAGSRYAVLGLVFLLITVVYNVTEAVFDRLNLIWVLYLMAAVTFPRRQRRGEGATDQTRRADAAQVPGRTLPRESAEGGGRFQPSGIF